MNVLIVDDSKVVADRLQDMLTDVSSDVRVIGHARNVVEGRQAVRHGAPDLIILDIQMPGGSGIELLEEVKREEPAPVVIMLTNYPHPHYRDRCFHAGADYFFDKSIEFEQVSAVLRNLLRSRDQWTDAFHPC